MSCKAMTAMLAVLGAGQSQAVELNYGVEVGIGSSDNISRVPTGAESETIESAGVELILNREEGRVLADVVLDLSYFDYQSNSFDSEVVGMAFAEIRAKIVPDTFDWIVTDSFGQLNLNPFEVVTPANRENVNFLTTGPDFRMHFSAQSSLLAFGRYSLAHYEESGFDDERMLGGLALTRGLSSNTNASLNMTAERIEFDDPELDSNYDRQSAFLRYQLDGVRTRIGADLGQTWIHDDGERTDNPLLDLELARKISEYSTLTLRGGIRSTDAASELLADSRLIAADTRGACTPTSFGQTASPDPYETRDATLCWQFESFRTSVVLRAGYEEDNYENETQLDRTREVFQAFVQRQVTPRIRLGVEGWVNRADFDDSGQSDDESQIGMYLNWNAVGRLWVEVDVEYFDRNSSNRLTEFHETRAFLRLAWRNQRDFSDVE